MCCIFHAPLSAGVRRETETEQGGTATWTEGESVGDVETENVGEIDLSIYTSSMCLNVMYCSGLTRRRLSFSYSSVTQRGITEVCCAQQPARLYTAALRQYS